MKKGKDNIENKPSVLSIVKPKKVHVDLGIKIAFTVIFTLYTIVLFTPFVWMLLNSFKDGAREYFESNTWAFPKDWKFSNYAALFELEDESLNFFNMFFYSIIYCLIVPTTGCISTTLAAYVMAKYKFKAQKVLLAIFLIPMIVHIAGTGSSMVLLFNRMGFDNMPFVGIALMAASGVGMNFLLVYSLFKTVSDTYMEAARIDGAGQFRIFGEIMLPHAMGIVGTIWVIGAIGAWNDYATPKIYLEDSEIYTIALGIQKIQSKVLSTNGDAFFRNNFPVFYAAIIISLIPVIVVFLIFQKKIMSLSLGGGIK